MTHAEQRMRMNNACERKQKGIHKILIGRLVLLSRSIVRNQSHKCQEVMSAVWIFLHFLIDPKNIG